MRISVHAKDIFDVEEADTLLLPIDASAPGLEGNISRQLMKRMEVEKMSDLYSPPPSYPFNGRCHWSYLGYKNFNWLCVIGTLTHVASPGDNRSHKDLVRDSLSEAIHGAYMAEVGYCPVMPLPTGGGRVSVVDAAYSVANVCQEAAAKYKYGRLQHLHVAERDPEIFSVIQNILT